MADISKITTLNGTTYNIKAKTIADNNDPTKAITIEYSGSGISSATWFPAFSGYAIKPMSAANVRTNIGAAASSHTHSSNDITAGYLNIHPENSPTIIPFIHNDIAFLLKRGGSATVKYDNTVQNIDTSNLFDGSGSYWAINPTGVTQIVIELTLHKAFGWTNTIYVDFGGLSWRSKSVKIELMNSNYSGDTWSSKYSTTTNSLGHVYVTTSHQPTGAENTGAGFNKIRLTFSDWNVATIFRISQIGVYNYGSFGVRETYMSRGIDDYVFRNITPNTTNIYSLGDSSHKWKDVQTTSLNGTTVPASPKFTDTTYESKAAASGGTAVSLVTTGEKYTWNNKGNGTITGIKMNGASKGTSGVVDLGTVITAHQDISGKADKSATVSTVTYDSTNKKLTKTINGTASDIVSVATLKTALSLAKGDVGLGNVENKSSATIRGELTKANVTDALGYTPPTSDTNTHRPIKVNGTEVLGNNTTALNLIPGSNVSITNGSSGITIAATNTTYTPASANPLMDGTVAIGTSAKYAREDHRHPSDTTKWTINNYGQGTTDLSIRPLIAVSRANRLAFLPADQIIIEKTTDGGTTWVDAGYSDDVKKALFATRGANILIPLLNNAKSTLCGIRITISGMKYNVPAGTPETGKYAYWNSTYVKSQERYSNLREMWFWLSANNDAIRVQVYRATGANPNNWITDFDTDFPLTGWSGSDWIRLSGNSFGGGTTQTGNYWNWRIIFWSRMHNGDTAFRSATQQVIAGIAGYGDSVWVAPNPLMKEDHLYTWDTDMNATFPAKITATGFVGNVTGNVSGTATNVTGTVAIGHGGTGATSALAAANNLVVPYLGTTNQLNGSEDLDTIITPGTYGVSSSSKAKAIANMPAQNWGVLLVNYADGASSTWPGQTYIDGINGDRYYRYRTNSGVWSAWHKFTVYSSLAAASGGADVSLVTTGEKYTWNNKLSSHQTIKQDGITGATVNRFGTCSTAAATAAKEVSITTGTFNLEAGARVSVKFSNANTANSPTLNVNSKGAKNIFHKGAQITSGSNKALLAGVVDFIYDGTQWHLIGNYIDSDSNTHRPIQVNGTEILGNNTTALNLKAGANVSVTNSSGTVTFAATQPKVSIASSAPSSASSGDIWFKLS